MILIIYPLDRSTKRLGRIASFLHHRLENNRLFVVHPNDKSKEECHEAISNCTESDLIVFLGHGRSDALYGAKGKYFDTPCPPAPSEYSREEDYDYFDENFIDKSKYGLFKNKKAIIYACKSSSLSKAHLKNEGLSFFGFGVVPTSTEEFETFNIEAPELLVSHMKGSITRILKRGLQTAIESGGSFGKLHRILEYQFQREIAQILSSKFRFKVQLVNALYRVKREMSVEGKLEIKLI